VLYSIVITIWSSITLGFVFGELWDANIGGAHGYFMSEWLISGIGSFGTILLILISAIAFILFAVDNAIDKAKGIYKQHTGKELPLKEFGLKISNFKKENQSSQNDAEKKSSKEKTQMDKTFEDENFGSQNAEKEKKFELGEVVNKNEFILNNKGEKKTQNVDKSENFSMEIEDKKTQNQDETIPENELINNYLEQLDEEKLALRVQKNSDITVGADFLNQLENYDPCLDLASYKIPDITLLEEHKATNSEVTNEELISNKNKIVETLKNYKIDIKKIKATIGPTITLYEIIPAPGVRISKIKSLEDDIALSLAALGIRIIAPMPGRGTVGIEVPNLKPEIVSMRSVITSAKFQNSKMELPIAIGKTISNESYVVDLTKMPHLLVAGATGQGKSVGLNAILTSILYKKHPAQVKFVLVDPKKVELTLYEKIERHFLAKLPDSEEAIITENQKVVNTLASLNVEMDNRYLLLKQAQCRTIIEYNEKFIARKLNPENGHRYLPYIVLVIDEFADLIMTAGKEVEMPISRLAQLARAIGIHLIVATQRPSTNIITGVIKANFPTRMAFKVASMMDSRTILDSPGANQLIGRGDMLISEGSNLIRVQCAYIDTPELERITDFIGSQRGYPHAYELPDYEVNEGNSEEALDVDLSKRDKLFEEAARIIVVHQQGSTSLIQRKLAIGYNRAGRIVDQLEAAGIIGPFEGSKARQVLFADEYSLEQYLNTLHLD
jgi:S-DNA-T family DNA segregation ATPase FtsK/SpoIIIE